MSSLTDQVQEIDRLKVRLDALRPLEGDATLTLSRAFELELIAESNGIEGNSLTLRETEMVLNQGVTISGKPLKDHLEALDHAEALTRMLELAQSKQPLDEAAGLELHALITRRSLPDFAGRYRERVLIQGSRHVPPNPVRVPEFMRELWAQTAADPGPVLLSAAWFHWRIAQIHPFADGNGRTARLLHNLFLLRAGYALFLLPRSERLAYYAALEASDAAESPDAFQAYCLERIKLCHERYLQVLEN